MNRTMQIAFLAVALMQINCAQAQQEMQYKQPKEGIVVAGEALIEQYTQQDAPDTPSTTKKVQFKTFYYKEGLIVVADSLNATSDPVRKIIMVPAQGTDIRLWKSGKGGVRLEPNFTHELIGLAPGYNTVMANKRATKAVEKKETVDFKFFKGSRRMEARYTAAGPAGPFPEAFAASRQEMILISDGENLVSMENILCPTSGDKFRIGEAKFWDFDTQNPEIPKRQILTNYYIGLPERRNVVVDTTVTSIEQINLHEFSQTLTGLTAGLVEDSRN